MLYVYAASYWLDPRYGWHQAWVYGICPTLVGGQYDVRLCHGLGILGGIPGTARRRRGVGVSSEHQVNIAVVPEAGTLASDWHFQRWNIGRRHAGTAYCGVPTAELQLAGGVRDLGGCRHCMGRSLVLL